MFEYETIIKNPPVLPDGMTIIVYCRLHDVPAENFAPDINLVGILDELTGEVTPEQLAIAICDSVQECYKVGISHEYKNLAQSFTYSPEE